MTSIHAMNLSRLRWGLFGLVAALVLDAVDVEVEDLDVLHDGAALALYALAGFGLGQRAGREHGAVPALFWLPLVARAAASLVPMISKDVERSTWISLGLLLAFTGALVAVCVSMERITKGAGLSSSSRWRSTKLHVLLLATLPGALTAFMVTRPAVQLPFFPYVGSLDSTWYLTIVQWAAMIMALLAVASVVLSAWTTWRSAGRRT